VNLQAIFKEIEGEKRFLGYSTVDYSSSDKSEVIVSTSEDELDNIIPDGVEGDWRDNKHKYYIDSEKQILFDKDYEPPKPTGGN